MALREEFESAGNWLFKWRSYLPIFMVGVLVAGMRDFAYPRGSVELYRAWGALCFAVSLLGLVIRIKTVGHTPARTSGKNTQRQVADTVNRTGMYSAVRHPLYLGNFVITLGIAMFVCSWWVVLTVILLFILYYERMMFAEEAFLRKKFGAEYENWAARTPAFVPGFRFWSPPALPFSMKNVIKREYGGYFGIVASFVFLDMAAGLITSGEFRLDIMWTVIAAVSAVFYLVVRILRKHTTVLDVPGR